MRGRCAAVDENDVRFGFDTAGYRPGLLNRRLLLFRAVLNQSRCWPIGVPDGANGPVEYAL